MRKANDLNINTKRYWNDIYGDDLSRAMYASQGTDTNSIKIRDDISVMSKETARFRTALKYIDPEDKVLDIGCGVGVFTKLTKEKYPESDVWGVDISDKAIDANKRENPTISYHQGYIGSLDFLPQDYYDVIFCGETIEHLEKPRVLFEEAKKMLKKGGKLIITTPKDDHIQSDEHLWYFNQEDVEHLFLTTGYNEVKFEYLPDMEHLYVIFAVGISI